MLASRSEALGTSKHSVENLSCQNSDWPDALIDLAFIHRDTFHTDSLVQFDSGTQLHLISFALVIKMATSAPRRTFCFLTSDQVQRLHKKYINSSGVLTQPGLLDSAINGPMNAKHYGSQENIFQLAANLSTKIMMNHAYLDGNKRTGLVAANMFLKINGYKLQKVPLEHDNHNEALANAHVSVVTKEWTTEQLGDLYQSVATAVETEDAETAAYRDGAVEF